MSYLNIALIISGGAIATASFYLSTRFRVATTFLAWLLIIIGISGARLENSTLRNELNELELQYRAEQAKSWRFGAMMDSESDVSVGKIIKMRIEKGDGLICPKAANRVIWTWKTVQPEGLMGFEVLRFRLKRHGREPLATIKLKLEELQKGESTSAAVKHFGEFREQEYFWTDADPKGATEYSLRALTIKAWTAWNPSANYGCHLIGSQW